MPIPICLLGGAGIDDRAAHGPLLWPPSASHAL
ncbi:hypothetical protein JOF35_000324 [Streptomyces demainii]|uniref:Uncharacterized protein n=1 Tax=Streptomyces demainii TaxID=588122 RepID=A0ABT9KKI5_9ACTN|nr:hypothetical protein [Streptomyces demainii]